MEDDKFIRYYKAYVGNTGTDYDKIMGSRRLLALFCEYIVAKSKQAVWHEKIVKQIYRLRKENRI